MFYKCLLSDYIINYILRLYNIICLRMRALNSEFLLIVRLMLDKSLKLFKKKIFEKGN